MRQLSLLILLGAQGLEMRASSSVIQNADPVLPEEAGTGQGGLIWDEYEVVWLRQVSGPSLT